MHFEPDHIYHVYNRGNNKTPIFFNEENYFFLLKKIKNEWLAYCDIFCYCLMPNHFHFMLLAKPEGCDSVYLNGKKSDLQKLSKTIGKTLSSYTQAINNQNNTSGNLFQKKTKSKCLTDLSIDVTEFHPTEYLLNCFNYIHLNPLKANLVKKLEEWPYSSWPDYYGFRNETLCNKKLTIEKIGLSPIDFNSFKEPLIDKKIIEMIW